jgi:transcriptional regulator with XRE-family HTH domain
MDILYSEGERLKELRKALGYSLYKMAAILETDINTLQQCEQDLFVNDTQILKKLASINVNINWLFTGRGERAYHYKTR